ncbi:MAG: Fic family protein, partial [Bacteroidetes bacterium]|nr:Fic family protein [Bacteroidota bacterium]
MSLSIHTVEELSKLPFIDEINQLKAEADSFKPLSKETEDRILQKFRLDWNYHSNAIEGNKLTYGETVAFLLEGTTAKAKPLKDHLDIKGHDEAVKYLISLVKDKNYLLTETEIRNLHKLLLKEPYWVDAVTPDGLSTRKEIKIGEYKSSTNHVITPTGETHYYATLEQTPIMMGELMEWYKDAKEDKAIHPLILASLFHHQFVAIHPFDDGNGRMARLLMNMMLMQETYPPVVVKQEDRQNYYQVLRQADAGELIPICEYMSNLLKHSLTIYIKGAKGESIAEEDDVDKEIKLFVKSKITNEKLGRKYSIEYQQQIISNSIVPLV